jgi:hypothetical protein
MFRASALRLHGAQNVQQKQSGSRHFSLYKSKEKKYFGNNTRKESVVKKYNARNAQANNKCGTMCRCGSVGVFWCGEHPSRLLLS